MASAADLKMAVVVCVLLLSAGQLMIVLASAAGPVDGGDVTAAPLLRLPDQLEAVEEEEELQLAFLDGDGAGASIVCSSSCKKCLLGCGMSCVASIVSPPSFVACFLECAFAKDCFGQK